MHKRRSMVMAGLAILLASGFAISLASSAGLPGPGAQPILLEQLFSKRINVNTASQKELEKLPGIGPKIAREIIRQRPYRDGKELQDKVKGIGPKTWEEIKNLVSFTR